MGIAHSLVNYILMFVVFSVTCLVNLLKYGKAGFCETGNKILVVTELADTARGPSF